MKSIHPRDLESIPLQTTAAGVVLPVHAQPGARRQGIVGIHNGRLKVAVTQVPEKGKANLQLAKVLADALGVNRSAVSLSRGETKPFKEFVISGLSLQELRDRLSQAGEGTAG